MRMFDDALDFPIDAHNPSKADVYLPKQSVKGYAGMGSLNVSVIKLILDLVKITVVNW